MIKKAVIILVVAVGLYWFFSSEEELKPDALVGKKVLVTGASSGIGEQIAYQFAKHGANVVITARRENLLQKVLKKCKEFGRKNAKFDYVVGDMNSEQDPDFVVQQAVDVLGGLDYLILNHAFIPSLEYWKGSTDDLKKLQKIMNINFQSYVSLTSSAMPYLNKTQGSIHVVSSGSGRLPTALFQGYTASKYALEGFFASLRVEFEKSKTNISITVGVLGLIDTPGAETAMSNSKQAFGMDFKTLTSFMKMASPEDTAYAIMKSTALRQREIFFPTDHALKFNSRLYSLSPELFEWQRKFLFSLIKE